MWCLVLVWQQMAQMVQMVQMEGAGQVDGRQVAEETPGQRAPGQLDWLIGEPGTQQPCPLLLKQPLKQPLNR